MGFSLFWSTPYLGFVSVGKFENCFSSESLIDMMEGKGDVSLLDVTTADTALRGGVPNYYGKLKKQYGYQFHNEIFFNNLSFECKITCTSPATIGTWLTGCFEKKTKTLKSILKPMSGTLTAGTCTLLLGGPGSGKSTLLRVLAGQLPSSKPGSVTINGVKAKTVAKYSRTIGFVPQKDEHHPLLTVRETLDFARACHLGHDDSGLKKVRSELIMKVLGISHVADTIVGSSDIRGVSGGQRRRVSIGECLVGDQGFLVMDEMNTGLDSQSTLEVVQGLKTWCDILGGTAIVSMLQPQKDVMEQFDRIMIINDGYLVYNGPMNKVLEHFAAIGIIPIIAQEEIAEFLLREVCKHPDPQFLEQHYYSQYHHDEPKSGKMCKLSNMQFTMTPFQEFKLLVSRQWKLNYRNRSLNLSLALEAIFVGLLLGISFFDVRDIQLVYGLLFFLASILVRQSWQVIPVIMQARDILYKQRDLRMHRVFPYTVAFSIAQLPMNLGAVFVLSTIVYFMANLAGSDFVAYIITCVTMCLLSLCLRAWMSSFAAIAPNSSVAQGVSAVFVMLSLLFSGFIITVDLISDAFIWIFWLSPVSWAMRSLVQVEFQSKYYSDEDEYKNLLLYSFSADMSFIWIGILVLLGYYLVFGFFVTYLGLRYRNPSKPVVYDIKKDGNKKDITLTITTTKSILRTTENSADTQSVKTVVPVQPGDSRSEFIPVTLTTAHLGYKVGKIELLQDISVQFEPGTLTCLMGSSGAGKTTLLDVIAQRKNEDQVTGKVLCNGLELAPSVFRNIIGYVEQYDTLSPQMTVWETLLFSARLRLTGTSMTPEEWCLKQMDILNLHDIGSHRVGSGESGLSNENRKRVSMAQELCGNPSILFLDEPTSGLDAEGALLVVDSIQNIAKTQRTVVCTIHQPSSMLFSKFNQLVLLQKGGQLIYFGQIGEHAKYLIDYLHQVPGLPPSQTGENPASFMLRAIASNKGLTDLSAYYKASELAFTPEIAIQTGSDHDSDFAVEKYPVSNWTQLEECYIRANKVYFRSPEYTFIRLLLALIMGAFLGAVYFQQGLDTADQVKSQIGIIFLGMDMVGIVSMVLLVPITYRERAVFYREAASSYYARMIFPLSIVLTEIPYIFLNAFLFLTPLHFLIGFDSASYMWQLLVWSLFLSCTTFVGLFLCFALPTASVAQVCIGVLTGAMNIFSGFLLPRDFIPAPLLTFHYVNSDTFVLNTLVTNLFCGCPYTTEQVINNTVLEGDDPSCRLLQGFETVQDYVIRTFMFQPERMHLDILVLVTWVATFIIGTLISGTYLTWIKK